MTQLPKITCLVDNAAGHGSRMWAEHGLAFLIEAEAGRVLFDTGQSGTVLLHNLEELAVAPETLDAVAISHAHYDHTGGLPALLERTRPLVPLHAHPDLFRERFSRRGGKLKSTGLPVKRESLASQTTLLVDASPHQVMPGIWTTGEIAPRPEPVGRSPHHLVRAPQGWVPDPYQDDMSLVVEVESGLVLLCGCCHAGLLNTLYRVQYAFERPVVAIAGGTHLVSASADHLRRVSEVLVELESVQRIYLNHCSGTVALHTLLLTLGPTVVRPCPAGTQIDFEASEEASE